MNNKELYTLIYNLYLMTMLIALALNSYLVAIVAFFLAITWI